MSENSFKIAAEKYAAAGVDVEKAISRVASVPVSVHCWQGDDVRGFESADASISGGLATTGNYPGRARNIDELRADIHEAFSFIPGIKRLSLHAIYLDNLGKKVERTRWSRNTSTAGSIGESRKGSTLTSTPRISRIRWLKAALH